MDVIRDRLKPHTDMCEKNPAKLLRSRRRRGIAVTEDVEQATPTGKNRTSVHVPFYQLLVKMKIIVQIHCSLLLSVRTILELKPVPVFGYVAEEGYAHYGELMNWIMFDKELEIYGCKLCIANDKLEENTDKHKMLDHIEMYHVKSAYECGECGIILPTRAIINTHKLKRHKDAILNSSKKTPEIHQLQKSGTANCNGKIFTAIGNII